MTGLAEKAKRSRPAEAIGVTAGVGVVVGRLLGVEDPDVLAGLALAVGAVPGLVTYVVSNGGLRGVLGAVWRGR